MRSEEIDSKSVEIEGIGNYHGGLNVSTHDGKFYWCVEDYNGFDWKEMPESLYVEMLKYNDGE